MKEKLAIQGGMPVRDTKIYYGRQWIDQKDIEAVTRTLESPFLTCGPKVEELEERLCQYTGAKHAVVVSNGTAALHCACIAAGVGPGDEVITTPLTFAASANCAAYCGATPVFADVDSETYLIDPKSIERCITKKTKAIVAVDYTGQVVEIDEIRKICDQYGLTLIEDAAHSIGSKSKGKMVGNLADLTTFSFHPVKTITGGEGGATLTNDDRLYHKLVLAHAHGITHNLDEMDEDAKEGPWYYEQLSLGYNYRMTDFQAALLLSQMDKIEFFKQRRIEIVKKYNEAFSEIPELILQKNLNEEDTCRHLYMIQLRLDKLNCTRKEFFEAMSAENVQCQIHYIPVYWFPFYKQYGYERGLCPKAEEVYKGILSIPLYPRLSDEDVDDVIHAVKKLVCAYRK